MTSLPTIISAQATLCRASKGNTCVVIDSDVSFPNQHIAKFGDAKVRIVEQHGHSVQILLLEGTLPTKLYLYQETFAYEPDPISEHFKKNWISKKIGSRFGNVKTVHPKKIWNLGSRSFKKCKTSTFRTLTSKAIFIHNPEIWISTIHKMKKTAHGVCGWRIEELCFLPKPAVCLLVGIYTQIWPNGMPSSMMKARTILLAKG